MLFQDSKLSPSQQVLYDSFQSKSLGGSMSPLANHVTTKNLKRPRETVLQVSDNLIQ